MANEAVEDLVDAAERAILASIEKLAGVRAQEIDEPQVRKILSLSEAYAWVHNPDQPHGATSVRPRA